MKNLTYVILATFFLALARNATAQVDVEAILSQDQAQFLPGEPIPLRVRIVNHAGEPLRFDSEDWLSYAVESRDGSIVEKSQSTVIAPHGFEVKPSERVTTRAEVSPSFQIADTGRYSVTASVTIKEWHKTITTKPVFFDVVKGNNYWEQEFGIPSPTNSSALPEVRKYILIQATLNNRLNLYMRLTDGTGNRSFVVRSLGSMISFSNTKAVIDASNNLHVLYQEASRQYHYIIINTNGEITRRSTYAYTDSAPRMKSAPDGSVEIAGGAKVIADTDFPPKNATEKKN